MKLSKTYIEGMYILKDEKPRLVTQNKTPGKAVYGEQLINVEGVEYRTWDPYRSKFAAAYLSGMKQLPQIFDEKILYLGVSTGTTASHFSDILDKGLIYGIEFSPKVMRKFFRLSEQRTNLVPILADARKPEEYSKFIFSVDLIYQDVAQPDQATIFGRNANEFLKQGGKGVLAIKSQSIDVSLEPEEVFSNQMKELEDKFSLSILEFSTIDTFEKKHAIIVIEKA
ncbi:MAG: fibrillarin-like rRNA/tRNA 2'-O-methyltransferase [Candidatus Heimdallarchaeota archaeon]|nr:fibrillarin-like rRNA/tRNA 2'-O-methyltransferase [Candidatus Heimdallarchaeota archaeon]